MAENKSSKTEKVEGEAEGGDEQYWEVEKILEKRVVRGKIEYKLRWTGWGPSYDSWQKVEDIDCPELIARFEEKLARREAAQARAESEPEEVPLYAPGEPTGFDRGLEAEAITGVTKIGREIVYFVKWKNMRLQGIVSGEVARRKCPLLVIEYMENNIRRADKHSN